MKFELGHNEIDDTAEPELRIADDLIALFADLGLPAPGPIPVLRADHQIAQKLHAVSEAGSERVRDIVDLQLLDKGEDLDLAQVKATCVRLFDYRRQQAWPPRIEALAGLATLYEAATEEIGVLPAMDAALAWVNAFVQRIAAGGSQPHYQFETAGE